ncbi:MAG: bifunctional (p)ppGpp synthetase/guanosine-3',5'-bis(diphosphate) 3'-pyrophosphohydrolase [Defluviitaleaceae bacterium]|nr:bifunctional (p)ppGpp synthetase/guanosine-3',5'-bis(diphosphate) 3'-pyrophosphohydrolase [Defluviitaleaceae bacterium]MCL2274747.1 bifunctional (p)ppGpp synthetase/guanosine-3',5'-bis(diphosphate) 3'-pyrophosphohydrolase [Defluviitaleaceae bacterium]
MTETAMNHKIIDEAYSALVAVIKSYRPHTSLELVDDAFNFAREAHKTQFRQSGEPFIMHPLAVATILAEMRSDLESIAAGILHDVVEDTEYTNADISERFGSEIALIVDGVTKLEKVEYNEYTNKTLAKTDEQAENYRKMFFHMSQDIRVLIVKIADRLHNMRTLSAKKPEKQRETAQETLDIYAPLAHRLGIARLRYELEDLAFKYHDRADYDELAKKVQMKRDERLAVINVVTTSLELKLKEEGIKAHVEGRPKHFYSIYKKMRAQDKTLDQIYDLFAVRIIVEEISDCYAALGWVHTLYTPVPGRIKDYISMPKLNRYQSLHTTLVGPVNGEPFEVQIRTRDMHAVAEYGIAAHWKYKEGGKDAKDSWLADIMSWQRELSNNEEFLDALKMDLSAFKGHVYCFTPAGQVIPLAAGANTIDFAYAIHSAVGNRMNGARVNGRIVNMDHVLSTGDRVEILTSQNVKGPSRDWLKIVKTAQARSKINQWFKRQSRVENIAKGRELLEEVALREVKVPLEELLDEGRTTDALARFNCKDLDQLFAMIGVGGLKEKQVANHLFREWEKAQPLPSDEEILQTIKDEAAANATRKKKSGIVVKGIGDTDVRFAKCCGPLPGDEILGYVTRGRGLTVHRSDCVNITHMDELDRRRLMDAQWQVPERAGHTYHTDLHILCDDRDGLLADVYRVFQEEKIKIDSLSVRSDKALALFNIGVEVTDGEHLTRLFTRLRREYSIRELSRVNA